MDFFRQKLQAVKNRLLIKYLWDMQYLYFARPHFPIDRIASYAPVSAPCYQQKTTRTIFRNRNRAKYTYYSQKKITTESTNFGYKL